jgi:hypothetical protein
MDPLYHRTWETTVCEIKEQRHPLHRRIAALDVVVTMWRMEGVMGSEEIVWIGLGVGEKGLGCERWWRW